MPAPRAPATPAVASPKTDNRALAEVSDIAAGSTRGTTAARSTLLRLRQHEDAERRRIEPEVVVVGGHHQRQHAPAEVAGGDRPPAAALQPVQRRPDDRGEHGERGHRDQQVQRDVAALGVGGRREEQRPGQRDGDHRVPGHVQGVDPQELGQAALAGAVGPAGRAHPVGRRDGELLRSGRPPRG